jgi:glycosyltransferase involved in cell wall biosynthesis
MPELDYTTPQVEALKERVPESLLDEKSIEQEFATQVRSIKDRLRELVRLHHPQVIHVRNILSLPIHPAATVAMAEFIAESPAIGFVTQHHDFAYEDDFVPGDRQKAYTIPYPAIQKRVEQALLYNAPNVRHAVINSLLQKRLAAQYGISAAIIPDSFDFETRPLEIPGLREKIGVRENDVLIGMMTRIIPRKAIEVAIQFVAELQKHKNELLGAQRGRHGRTITDESRFVLLLPQAAGLDEPANALYFEKLQAYSKALGVTLHYIGDRVVADSAYTGIPETIPFYSLYHEVDILTFPSYQEGFGNQYLEAVALGKGLVVCHAYPVMEADILPHISREGIISLGNNNEYTIDADGLIRLDEAVLQAAVAREIYFLLHPADEETLAAETRRRLRQAFDAGVVGRELARILSEAGRLA